MRNSSLLYVMVIFVAAFAITFSLSGCSPEEATKDRPTQTPKVTMFAGLLDRAWDRRVLG